MEEIVQSRLKLLIDNIDYLTNCAQTILQDIRTDSITIENMDEVKITSSKLKTAIDRFINEMYNYYKLAENPSADDLAKYTDVQIKGDETYAELNYWIQKFDQRRPDTITNSKRINVASKLPKMELAKFNGDVLMWHQFWDQFSSNIHNRSINDVDKLLYLQSVLEGEAKRAIEGLGMTNKNYQIAVTTLKERYGKKSSTIDAHYSALYKIQPANKSISDCRRVFNEVERHLRVLGSLGEDVNHNHLRVLIMQKFSEDLIYELRIKMGTDIDSIDVIRKHLEHIISAREDSNRMKEGLFISDTTSDSKTENNRFTLENLHTHIGTEDRMEKQSHRDVATFSTYSKDKLKKESFTPGRSEYRHNGTSISYDRKRRNDQTNVKISRREPNGKRKKLACIFCGNGHFNDECTEVTSILERRAKLKGRCFNCLSKGHFARECRSNMKCRHCGKYGEHNRSLCPTKMLMKTNVSCTQISQACESITDKGVTVLQTAIAKINKIGNGSRSKQTRILLDCGSQRSYITSELAKQLNLESLEEIHLSVFTFGASFPREIKSSVVNFEISTRVNSNETILANVVPHITNHVSGISNSYIENILTEIVPKDLVFADEGSLGDRIDVLIGNDYYYSFITGEKIEIAKNFYLVNSIFGWLLSGRYNPSIQKNRDELSVLTYFQSDIACNSFDEPDLPLKTDNLKILWDLESIGIKDSPDMSWGCEAIKQFNETTQYYNRRYFVKWPWIEYPPPLPSNYGLAYGRLRGLLKRLPEDTIQKYDKTIKEQLDKNIIEFVDDTTSNVQHPIHYLPHHCVIQHGKLRIVYDASAKVKGNKSLNECLYRGPLMLEDLTGLLIRFREHLIGIVADVEKAFLQVGLHREDRDVTRFLWPKNPYMELSPENVSHLRFCRVPFGIISSPFLLNATIRYHLMKSKDTINKKIAEDIYVDNLVTGANSVFDATLLYKKTKETFNELSMNLREWNSNSTALKESIPPQFLCKEKEFMKVLGLNWDLINDQLSLRFNPERIRSSKMVTKREILKYIASVFDPCGFAVPLLLPAKLFLQNLWHEKVQWDTEISEEATREWDNIRTEVERINEISIPRYFLQKLTLQESNEMAYELHVFTDSSLNAYAAVVYLRGICDKGIELAFVIGKSRLIAKKDQSDLQIPKLELMGALIGSRLIRYVFKFIRLPIKEMFLWTDSQIVISWCNSNKLLPPFVFKRVEEIKRNESLKIKYIPSKINPADIATRSDACMLKTNRWLKGPEFLFLDSINWPKTNLDVSENIVSCISSCGQGPPEGLAEETNFNNTRLLQESDNPQTINEIDASQIGDVDLNNVDEIINVQKLYFPDESNGTQTDIARTLGVYKDKRGLLRCGGRLVNTHWDDCQKHPILLPKDSAVAAKLIEEVHKRNYHVGVTQTLSLVRKRFWIPQGRRQVQKILSRCLSCRKYGGGPYKLPIMAPLPSERVSYSNPFTYVGIDYFGPLTIDNRGCYEKRWVLLCTCLAIRAVHLEVVTDMSAEECLMGLRRFISTRGVPKMIVSDNALYFKLTAEVLTNNYCIRNNIKWKFIPELAPWFGGFYERLIGIVKNCLKRTIDKHILSHIQLCTVIKEKEAVVNSRPLTVVGTDIEHVLSPADFLCIGGSITFDVSEREFLETATITKASLVDGWKRGQRILQEYIKMFNNQYLTSLRDRKPMHRQGRGAVPIIPKIGDLVQVKGGLNRAHWKVGRISDVITGSDGLIRVAKVFISPNETLTRSIAHLYPLEVQESESEVETSQSDNTIDNAQANESNRVNELPTKGEDVPSRQKRLTALRARERVKVWTSQLLSICYT